MTNNLHRGAQEHGSGGAQRGEVDFWDSATLALELTRGVMLKRIIERGHLQVPC